jgi:hypothetical protein
MAGEWSLSSTITCLNLVDRELFNTHLLIIHNIYHIQGVIFSQITHLISLRGAVYCPPDIFTSKGLHVLSLVKFCLSCINATFPLQGKPLTALTWGHNDKRLFLATGCYIHVAWVHKTVASLQFLAQQAIKSCLKDENAVQKTPLPAALRFNVGSLFSTTIKVSHCCWIFVTVYGKTRPKSPGKIQRKRGKVKKKEKLFCFF